MRFVADGEIEVFALGSVGHDFYGIAFLFIICEPKGVFHVHFQGLGRRHLEAARRSHYVFTVDGDVESLKITCKSVCEVSDNAYCGYYGKQ